MSRSEDDEELVVGGAASRTQAAPRQSAGEMIRLAIVLCGGAAVYYGYVWEPLRVLIFG